MFNYRKFVLEHIKENCFCMLKERSGVFNHPFVVPGAGYESDLWDWDSYWSGYALLDIVEYFSKDANFDYAEKREKVLLHLKGNILNFLENKEADGFIPGTITSAGLFSTYFVDRHKAGKSVNQCKPFLCAAALRVSQYEKDAAWIEGYLTDIADYLEYYERCQKHQASGLYFWMNDIMIGIDNNPTVFGRPEKSSGDIFLNCFMYAELVAAAKLFEMAGKDGNLYAKRAQALKESINRYMYDENDGFYYSVDLQTEDHSDEIFHKSMKPFWTVLPIKIKLWAGFLPMTFGISSPEQNARLIQTYLDPQFFCEYGIRTLSSKERMYTLESTSNPSNWLGPVWIVSNYCLFKGLLAAGRKDLADDMKERTLKVLGMDIQETGKMSESYIPETGERMMWNGFLNWNCLAVSMIKESEL